MISQPFLPGLHRTISAPRAPGVTNPNAADGFLIALLATPGLPACRLSCLQVHLT